MSDYEFAMLLVAVFVAMRSKFTRREIARLLKRLKNLKWGPFAAEFGSETSQSSQS